MRNLITAQEVIELAFAENSNMREDSISETSIRIAEIKYIRPAFGVMYPLLADKYADFTNDYVKPALAYFVKCEIVSSIAIDMSNSGVAVANPQYQSAATDKQRQRLYDSEMSKAKTLLDFALSYIAENKELFPDFSGEAPKKHHRLGGILLGGVGTSRGQSASITGDAFKAEFDKYIKEMSETAEEVEQLIESTGAITEEAKIAAKSAEEAAKRADEATNKLDLLIPITYSELVALLNERKLKAGAFYRITDYECTTTQEGTRSANHPFDIIVQALDENTLSENAQAIQHKGDEYFADAKLESWKLKYAIDNNASRFAWAKELIIEQPAKWSCDWGILEERYDDEGMSSNYKTVTIDGVQKYLYRPAQPTSYLDGKEFYRFDGRETMYVDSLSDVIFVSEENPYGNSGPMLAIHRATGKVIDTFDVQDDWGETETGEYDDNGEPVFAYNINFYNNRLGEAFDMLYYGRSVEIGNKTYYEWLPWNNDYYSLEEYWFANSNPFIINEGTKVVYNGPMDNLYYALDNPLDNGPVVSVFEISDGEQLYKYDNSHYPEFDLYYHLIDTIAYSHYIAPLEGGKGVVYRMIDEHNNDCPFDFKNMQFLHEGEWYYTFTCLGEDLSLTDLCCGNYIQPCIYITEKNTPVEQTMPRVVFEINGESTTGIYNNCFEVGIHKGYISAKQGIFNNRWTASRANLYLVEELYIKATNLIYNNVIRGIAGEFIVGKDSITNGFFGNTLTLPATNTYSAAGVKYATIISFEGYQYARNEFNLSFATNGFSFNGTFVDNYIEDSGVSNEGGIPLADVKTYLSASRILLNSKLTIKYDNTTAAATPLRFLNIDARGWGDTTLTIPTSFPTNANYELKIAKNSEGTIKMWCDADLVN